ncbi:MAG: cytochrome bc complex cytochrome b subunit [Acidobacteriota bacterium]
MSRAGDWLAERFPVSPEQLRTMTNEPVPLHLKRFWFALGGTPAYLFVVQVVTGIILAFYYQPTPATAYESVRYITEEAAFGWYVRGLHKWGATLMIAAVILHQMRVYFTGAYRKPRELNWMVGMTLLIATLMLGFTGYSLVYEQLSYWGATVGANMAAGVPLIGNLLQQMLLGGETYNEHTLSRFYVLHAAVLPMLIVILVMLHIALIRMHGIAPLEDSNASKPVEQKTFDFFPDHVITELIVGLGLMIVLSVLATVIPASLGPPANPLVTPEVIKPEWFFYVAFRWLKLFSGTFALMSIGFIVFVMYVWPWIDGWFRRRTRFTEASVWIGIVAALGIIALTVWEGLVTH